MYGEAKSQYGHANVPMTANSQPAPPATLVGAISGSAMLIDRLQSLNEMVASLACRIGGPFPAEAEGISPALEAAPAMVLLNDNIDNCHRLASRLEGAVKAISRSLEG